MTLDNIRAGAFTVVLRRSKVSEMYVSRLRRIRKDSRPSAVHSRGNFYLGQRHKGNEC